jgi:hypothetical protein
MSSSQTCVITIIAEARLEQALGNQLGQLGAKRYSASDVSAGTARAGERLDRKRTHIRIDVIAPANVAQDIVGKLESEGGDQSSIICLMSNWHGQVDSNASATTPAVPPQRREVVWGDYIINV